MNPTDKPTEQAPASTSPPNVPFSPGIRTGLGLMGIGFAVSRFGLFLRQLAATDSHIPTHTTGLSLWSGVVLVTLGVIVTLSSVLRHIQLIHQLGAGTWQPGRVSRDAVILAFILAAVGIGMAIYLILVP